ncbi:alkaline phosphatase D family protein [Gilvibacter sp.]|uniref:alkaline phosphatase D family protein n=1 Tax=Gilvibacter sp. TaxID=2729997 RepID=UPI003F4A4F7D
MYKLYLSLALVLCISACKNSQSKSEVEQETTAVNDTLTFVFASCNDQEREQPLWNPILGHKPELFIWGGDNIYSDTRDSSKMRADYDKQFNQPDYTKLRTQTKVIGTWDDHDYGENDAGAQYPMKIVASELFWDFMELPKGDSLRDQPGVFHSYVHQTEQGSVKFILLDTRYYRDPLLKSEDPNKRYTPWTEDHDGWFLGPLQWVWLENQLKDTTHDFTFIVSSIQFLNNADHGWEKWGNFPAERNKMYEVLKAAQSKNIILLSGDRHHAEMSKDEQAGLGYPLLDFTASGLTHTFPGSPLEPNEYRWGEGTKDLNFGLIKVHQASKTVVFEIRGKDDVLIEQFVQAY